MYWVFGQVSSDLFFFNDWERRSLRLGFAVGVVVSVLPSVLKFPEASQSRFLATQEWAFDDQCHAVAAFGQCLDHWGFFVGGYIVSVYSGGSIARVYL